VDDIHTIVSDEKAQVYEKAADDELTVSISRLLLLGEDIDGLMDRIVGFWKEGFASRLQARRHRDFRGKSGHNSAERPPDSVKNYLEEAMKPMVTVHRASSVLVCNWRA
jgi:hypothetical protein